MASRTPVRHLKSADPVLCQLIETVGPYRFTPRTEGTHFDSVARAIVGQQLSTKAAATIHARLLGLWGGRAPTPAELLATPEEQLRAVGLSRQKLGYLRSLAEIARNGELDGLEDLLDEEVVAALCQVKGIGRWTAQMFLIFRLGRPNVLPDGDLGIQKAIQRAWRMRKLPTPEKVRKVAAPWHPHCSAASWYLWRSLDGVPPGE